MSLRPLLLKLATALGLILAAGQAAAQQNLTVADVQQVIARAANEAQARGTPATIAVTDRVGNVLGVFVMNGAPATVTVTSGRVPPGNGLEGINVIPSTMSAIAKAVTGAYLSSQGNAFTTRTASQIVQEHFNPGQTQEPSGPLFGVQFSQLPCSDLSNRFVAGDPGAFLGPKRSPLGLSADPGGLPLYKNGIHVGGIGIESDGLYTLDLTITDIDRDDDEIIALAGTVGFDTPVEIRAERVTVDGKTLRYADATPNDFQSDPPSAPSFAAINGVLGNLVAVTGYNTAPIAAGTAFGTPASGVREENTGLYPNRRAFVLVDANNNNRFPPRAGTDGLLTANEVAEIISQALRIAFLGRAQIRRPLNSPIEVSISVVDTNGAILGLARTPDGPIFGTDVSLQKARTAALFSNVNAANDLTQGGFGNYVAAVRDFVEDDTALANGIAFADRSGGNLSRPFFPDGNINNTNGPLSVPFGIWSPFNVGLQLDMVINNIVEHVFFVATAGAMPDTRRGCTTLPLRAATGQPRVPNGIQIFPGSVPIYKNGFLVGGVGISGDGIDQDDMVSFLGLHNAGVSLASGVGNAPPEIRADRVTINGIRLRYVNCPFKPFRDFDDQSPCNGK